MYGSEKVLPYNQKEHKGVQVRRMFDAIAGKYDVLNHTLSFGFDKGWRRRGIRFLRPFAPKQILDIATGTGDLAIEMQRILGAERIIGADISEGMMQVGREKVARNRIARHSLTPTIRLTLLRPLSVSVTSRISNVDSPRCTVC